VSSSLAESYIDRAALDAGAAAEMAATRKEEKYVDLGARWGCSLWNCATSIVCRFSHWNNGEHRCSNSMVNNREL